MSTQRPSILVYPEALADRSQLRQELLKAGFQVVAANTRKRAVEAVKKASVRLSLVDPSLAGDGVYETLRELAGQGCASIIYPSGSVTSIDRLLSLGVVQYLPAGADIGDVVVNAKLALNRWMGAAQMVEKRGDVDRSIRNQCFGLYASEWEVPISQVRSVVTRFARDRNVRVDQLALAKVEHTEYADSLRLDVESAIEQAKPYLLRALEAYWESS